jgi:hypothetical protein
MAEIALGAALPFDRASQDSADEIPLEREEDRERSAVAKPVHSQIPSVINAQSFKTRPNMHARGVSCETPSRSAR